MTKSPRAEILEINRLIEDLAQDEADLALIEHTPRTEPLPPGAVPNALTGCSDKCSACQIGLDLWERRSEISKRQRDAFIRSAEAMLKIDPAKASRTRSIQMEKRRRWLCDKIAESGLVRTDIETSRQDRGSLRAKYNIEYDVSRKTFERDLKALGYRIS